MQHWNETEEAKAIIADLRVNPVSMVEAECWGILQKEAFLTIDYSDERIDELKHINNRNADALYREYGRPGWDFAMTGPSIEDVLA